LDRRGALLALNDAVGHVFGSEHTSLLLHTLARMHRPNVIIELGTGLGITSLWLAEAARLNNVGHVWSVDDHELQAKRADLFQGIAFALGLEPSAGDIYSQSAEELDLASWVTFTKANIDLKNISWLERVTVEPIDMLFSDFNHGPGAILDLFANLLPRMSPTSSLFIDSAPTHFTSFLLLNEVLRHIQKGRVPEMLESRSSDAQRLRLFVKRCRFELVHLTERNDRAQNSMAWLRISPHDLRPHPMARMRGIDI
jgi:hypothetical protein